MCIRQILLSYTSNIKSEENTILIWSPTSGDASLREETVHEIPSCHNHSHHYHISRSSCRRCRLFLVARTDHLHLHLRFEGWSQFLGNLDLTKQCVHCLPPLSYSDQLLHPLDPFHLLVVHIGSLTDRLSSEEAGHPNWSPLEAVTTWSFLSLLCVSWRIFTHRSERGVPDDVNG